MVRMQFFHSKSNNLPMPKHSSHDLIHKEQVSLLVSSQASAPPRTPAWQHGVLGKCKGCQSVAFPSPSRRNAVPVNFVFSTRIHNRSSILFGVTRPLCTGNYSEVYQARTLQPASVGLLTHTYIYVHFQHNRLWNDYGSSLRSHEVTYVAIMWCLAANTSATAPDGGRRCLSHWFQAFREGPMPELVLWL